MKLPAYLQIRQSRRSDHGLALILILFLPLMGCLETGSSTSATSSATTTTSLTTQPTPPTTTTTTSTTTTSTTTTLAPFAGMIDLNVGDKDIIIPVTKSLAQMKARLEVTGPGGTGHFHRGLTFLIPQRLIQIQQGVQVRISLPVTISGRYPARLYYGENLTQPTNPVGATTSFYPTGNATQTLGPSTVSAVTVGDRIFSRSSYTEYYTDLEFFFGSGTVSPVDFISDITYTSGIVVSDDFLVDPGLLTNFTIMITTLSGLDLAHLVSVTYDTEVDTFDHFLVGSLAETLQQSVISKLSLVRPISTELPIFSTQNHSGPSYLRNISSWISSLALNFMSPYNSYGVTGMSGTLISPRHIILANHWYPPNGTMFRFIDSSNNVIERSLTSSAQVASTDLRIGLLSADLPASIGFAKVFPTNVLQKFSANSPMKLVPVLGSDGEEKALVHIVGAINYGASNVPSYINYYQANAYEVSELLQTQKTLYGRYSETIISGDSGNPLFAMLGSELILLGTYYSAAMAPFVSGYNYNLINTVMTTLGGGYQLSPVDLSSYPNIL